MRDNRNGLPEIVEAHQEGEHYFGIIQLEKEGSKRRFRIGVSEKGYTAFKQALGIRPFDTMPGIPQRYFFVPSVQRLNSERAKISIRVEQERSEKKCG